MRQVPIQAMCVRIAVDLNIFRILAEAKEAGLTAVELAAKTNAEVQLIIRIMRVLTASGYGSEIGIETYSTNGVSE